MSSRYYHNDDYFNRIDNEEKSYWLGYIAADGNVHNFKGHLRFTLTVASKDLDHLMKFKSHINAENPFQKYKSGARSLVLCSDKLCNSLIDKGITERKTFVLKPPNKVPDDLIRHWIRGYFDGDGCINLRKDGINRRIHISGTKEVCEFINSNIPFYCSIKKNKGIYCIRVNQQKAVRWTYNYFYLDSNVFMERKYEKFNYN